MQAIFNLVLNWIWGKLSAFVLGVYNTIRRQKQVEDESKQSVDPLKKATTADEIDKATDDALGGF